MMGAVAGDSPRLRKAQRVAKLVSNAKKSASSGPIQTEISKLCNGRSATRVVRRLVKNAIRPKPIRRMFPARQVTMVSSLCSVRRRSAAVVRPAEKIRFDKSSRCGQVLRLRDCKSLSKRSTSCGRAVMVSQPRHIRCWLRARTGSSGQFGLIWARPIIPLRCEWTPKLRLNPKLKHQNRLHFLWQFRLARLAYTLAYFA
jgi:hypothetical protein